MSQAGSGGALRLREILPWLLAVIIFPLLLRAESPPEDPVRPDAILLTIFLKHDQGLTLAEIQKLQEEQGFWSVPSRGHQGGKLVRDDGHRAGCYPRGSRIEVEGCERRVGKNGVEGVPHGILPDLRSLPDNKGQARQSRQEKPLSFSIVTDERLQIFCDAPLSASARKMLEDGTTSHELIFPQRSVDSVLVSNPDPALATADIALGQPDMATVMDSNRLRWYPSDQRRLCALCRPRYLRAFVESAS